MNILYFLSYSRGYLTTQNPHEFRHFGDVVHADSLLSAQFSYELLMLSHEHRLYLGHTVINGLGTPTSERLPLLPSGGIVVERSPVRGFVADCRFLEKSV